MTRAWLPLLGLGLTAGCALKGDVRRVELQVEALRVSLYYVQGLNLTPAHGHAALFGVYGMLGIGLMLFCLRGLFDRQFHADRLLAWSFWSLNIGLGMMVFMSLVPAGIYQATASISRGLWYARSPELVHSTLMETLVWLRVPGDIIFAVGGVLLALYGLRLLWRRRDAAEEPTWVLARKP